MAAFESGAMRLVCAECKAVGDGDARGWIALLGEDVDAAEPPSVVVFCPDCAAKEFGYQPRRGQENA